ncbi:MAG TPA: hypothetical protein VFX15_02940 [Actinomycetes bacterium]|nr:hypothetical protein [Actinomycetes bacterium]
MATGDITHALVADGTPLVDDGHWNDGHVVDLAFAIYTRSAGNYSTSSTSFVDIDSTNLVFTITTGAHRVRLNQVVHVLSGATANQQIYFDVMIDGVRQGGATGLFGFRNANDTTQRRWGANFSWLTDVLTAGSHTFKFQYAVGSGTATLVTDGTNSIGQWSVEETLLTT